MRLYGGNSRNSLKKLDGNGNLTSNYSPYGKSATASGSFAHTSQRIDPETNGLHYYRARMYAPAWGRFMQPDPIGYAGGSNLYAYVGNDPLNFVDPNGLVLEQFGNYLSSSAAALSRAPSDIANMARDLVTDPRSFWQGVGPGLAGLGMSVPFGGVGAPAARSIGSIGTAGEEAVGIAADVPKIGIRITESGAFRYPDILTQSTIGEVKNVAKLSFTQQLQDYAAFAQSTGRTFDLYVRPNTTMTSPLREAFSSGQINLRYIPTP